MSHTIWTLAAYLAVALSLSGNVGVVRKQRWGMGCWVASNLIWIPYHILRGDWPSVLLFAAYMGLAARADEKGITFVAFTATPKAKTMELFGTRPDPKQPAGPGNLPVPFHVYSMRQAIEEKFILDVLQNYTTYKLAFKLAHNGKEYDQKEVERAAAMNPKLEPITEAGSGSIQEKQKALLHQIIQKLNDLFEGELTDQDKLVYVNTVLTEKLLESETLQRQASNNSKEQFANSPDLNAELMNAIIDAQDAHSAMSTQALNSEHVRSTLKDMVILLGLYEKLRQQAKGGA